MHSRIRTTHNIKQKPQQEVIEGHLLIRVSAIETSKRE